MGDTVYGYEKMRSWVEEQGIQFRAGGARDTYGLDRWATPARRSGGGRALTSGRLDGALGRRGQQVLPLVERVITQTRTRVLEGKKMASGEKVLSLFEPHTRAIPRHKGGALVEFGRQVVLDEVDGGIVTRYQILEHPTEHGQAVESGTPDNGVAKV